MAIWKLLKRLLLISVICAIGISSCKSQTKYEEQSLPELPFAYDLQEAIDQVLLAYQDYGLGISAAVLLGNTLK